MNEQNIGTAVNFQTEQQTEDFYKSLQIQAETKDLKKRCNCVGWVTLTTRFLFTVVSFVLVLFYTIFSYDFTFPDTIDSIPENILNSIVSLFSLGLLGVLFLKLNKTRASEVLIFSKVQPLKLIALVFIGFSVCVVSNMLTNFYLVSMYNLGINLNYDLEPTVSNSALEIATFLVSYVAVPAIAEEFIFRGVILSHLRKYGDGFAVLTSSLLFGLIHANFVQIPFAFIVGLTLGFATVYTNSMLPAIIIHAFNNGYSVISTILYTNLEGSSATIGAVNTLDYVFLIVCMLFAVIFTAIIAKKDKRFPKLQSYQGEFNTKYIFTTFLKSPGVIVATLYILAESVFNHAVTAIL